MSQLMKLVAIGTMVVSTPVIAQESGDLVTSVTVPHRDLDLRSDDDIDTSNKRIDRAAHEACGPASSIDLHGNALRRHCIQEARAAAVDQRDQLATDYQNGVLLAQTDEAAATSPGIGL